LEVLGRTIKAWRTDAKSQDVEALHKTAEFQSKQLEFIQSEYDALYKAHLHGLGHLELLESKMVDSGHAVAVPVDNRNPKRLEEAQRRLRASEDLTRELELENERLRKNRGALVDLVETKALKAGATAGSDTDRSERGLSLIAEIRPTDQPANTNNGAGYSPSSMQEYMKNRNPLPSTNMHGVLYDLSSPDGEPRRPGLLEEPWPEVEQGVTWRDKKPTPRALRDPTAWAGFIDDVVDNSPDNTGNVLKQLGADPTLGRTNPSARKGNPSFDELDVNRDGVLNREEYNAALQQGEARVSGLEGPWPGESQKSVSPGLDNPPALQDPWKREPPWAQPNPYAQSETGLWQQMEASRDSSRRPSR